MASITQLIKAKAEELGFFRAGVARCHEVDPTEMARYDRWISAGRHADMAYMERNRDVRANPELLLPGARSLIVCAMYYGHEATQPYVAEYAHGVDYHDVIRHRLKQLGAFVKTLDPQAKTRGCVDTAPLRERYWAQQAGLGFIGINNHLIIPDAGSKFFLGTLLTTLELDPDQPATGTCRRCMRCVNSCPAHAFTPDGSLDCRRCLSYLTIEHRGPFPQSQSPTPSTSQSQNPSISQSPSPSTSESLNLSTPQSTNLSTSQSLNLSTSQSPNPIDLHGHLFGCDICGKVCPHNYAPQQTATPRINPEFELSEAIRGLTPAAVLELTTEQFNAQFSDSPLSRATLPGLRRNALALLPPTKQP